MKIPGSGHPGAGATALTGRAQCLLRVAMS